jgi:hypothetical protein
MSLSYKKCEECGTKIDKLQNGWNLFLLKTGKKIICPNCKSEYKVNNIISFIGVYYSWLLISYISISILLPGQKLELLYLVAICIVLEYIFMSFLPLKKVTNEEFRKYNKFIYYPLTTVLTIILLYLSSLLISIIHIKFFSSPTEDWNAGDAIGGLIYVGGTTILIFPLIILVSNRIIKYLIKKNSK